MNAEMWVQITNAAVGKVTEYFTGAEVKVIMDFIQTAKQDVQAIIEDISASSGG